MEFYQKDLTKENVWRAIILFGRNVASYKFALGRALLKLAVEEKTTVSLEELAPYFVESLCEHIKRNPKQCTSNSSKFLSACSNYNEGKVTYDSLIGSAVKLGFNNVITAFHVVNQGEVPIRFYSDERQRGSGITMFDELLELAVSKQGENLSHEVEARWRLVETAWELNLPAKLLAVSCNPEEDSLLFEDSHRRINISSCRNSLNGYQKGFCFYSNAPISLNPGTLHFCDIDHFFPHTLGSRPEFRSINIDGVWNLVLASKDCNRGEGGKFAKVPKLEFLEKLHQRNEYFINSHHPLRETLINQTGKNETDRRRFLQYTYDQARAALIHEWEPQFTAEYQLL
jgi:hypothetical protein